MGKVNETITNELKNIGRQLVSAETKLRLYENDMSDLKACIARILNEKAELETFLKEKSND